MTGFSDYARMVDQQMARFGGGFLAAGVKGAATSTFEGDWPEASGAHLYKISTPTAFG
ncbi:hypothetical protein [Roseovarius albus]|nr:hypothetical protein [Roseovarius albus]